jgi:dTDP-4-dehydrorhamnose reductase
MPRGPLSFNAAGETSWHGYAEAIFEEALQQGLIAKKPTVHRIPSADYPLPAQRPQNSRLDCSRFTADFAMTLPDWRVGLADCLADARF